MTEQVPFTSPIPDNDSDPYWSALREGVVLFQRCTACGHAQLYFRAMCARCWSRDLEQVRSSGRGTVYSYTVVHQTGDPALSAELPFTLALVDLEEGPRVLSRLADGAGEIGIGEQVSATFRDIGEYSLLYFEKVGAA